MVDTLFKSPGIFVEAVAALEEFGIVKPVTGHEWTMSEALDTHFPPIPDWMVNGLAIVILLYTLTQLHVF